MSLSPRRGEHIFLIPETVIKFRGWPGRAGPGRAGPGRVGPVANFRPTQLQSRFAAMIEKIEKLSHIRHRALCARREVLECRKNCSLCSAHCSSTQPQPQPSPARPQPSSPQPSNKKRPSPAQPSPAKPSPAQPSPAQPSPVGYQWVISGLSVGYQRVIRGLSVGYQWVISGLSVGYQRVIRG